MLKKKILKLYVIITILFVIPLILKVALANTIGWQSEPVSQHSGLLTADYDWGSSWTYQINSSDGVLWDTELATLMQNNITSYQNIQIVMGQCYSGGFINDLQGSNTGSGNKGRRGIRDGLSLLV